MLLNRTNIFFITTSYSAASIHFKYFTLIDLFIPRNKSNEVGNHDRESLSNVPECWS